MTHDQTDSNPANSSPTPPAVAFPSAWWLRLRWPRWIPTLFGCLLVLWFARTFVGALAAISEIVKPVFVPLVISVALAYLMKPMVDRIEKFKVNRSLAVLLAMVLGTAGLCFLLMIFIPIGAQLSQATTKIPGAVQNFTAWIKPRLEILQQRYPSAYEKVTSTITENTQNPSSLVDPIVKGFGSVTTNLLAVLGSVLNLVLIPFFVYYILKDTGTLRNKIIGLIPPRHQFNAKRLTDQVDNVLSNYVSGQLIVCSSMSVLYILAFWALGVPLPIPLGVLSGFGHLVPYIGTLTAAVLTVLLTLVNDPSLWQVLLVITTYPVVQSTEGFVLTPLILGERLELHPFLVIVGLLLAHHLFGILGIMLAVPALAICKVFLEFMTELYETSDFYCFRPVDTEPVVDESELKSPATVEEVAS